MTQKLTIRSIIIGGLLSAIITMSAAYTALRMNAFYWASILTSLLAIVILKFVAKLTKSPTNIHEVNLTQTTASTGGILAAGICFTFPALFFLDNNLFQKLIDSPFSFSLKIFIVTIVGGILGVILSAHLRKPMILEEKLPFPTGIAAADTIKNIIEGTKKTLYLFSSFLFAVIFTTLRDGLDSIIKSIIPFFKGITIKGFNFQFGFIPLTIGGGYLIGFKTSMTWLVGCLASNWIYQPVLVNLFSIPQDKLGLNYILPLGVGVVIGSGLFIFIKTILPSIAKTLSDMFDFNSKPGENELSPRLIPFALLIAIGILTAIFKINILASILAVAGLWLMTVLASRMAGETNIDPMEILAVIVVIMINIFVRLSHLENIILAGIIAVAVGVAADLLFDLKAGSILGTSPLQLAKAQFIGVFTSSLVVGISLISLVKVYQLGSPELFAMQAQVVAFMIGNISWALFGTGLVIGILTTLIGFSGLAFGIGFFIPMFFSTGLAIGGLFKLIVDKRFNDKDEDMRLISAGLIGGEGVTGSLLAMVKMLML